MDIRSWPIDRIMQLPDCCFGRRWPVGVYATGFTANTYYDISEAGLGDRCVFWNLAIHGGGASTTVGNIAISLGDVLPATDAEFDALEPLFSDIGRRGADRRAIDIGGFGMFNHWPMRYPVMAQGRRLVGRIEITGADVAPTQAILTVASFPTEVPEWLISGPGRGL